MRKIISVLLAFLFCFCLSLAQEKKKEIKSYQDVSALEKESLEKSRELNNLISNSQMTREEKIRVFELLGDIYVNDNNIKEYYEKKLKSSELNTKILSEMLISYASYRPKKNYPDLDELKSENEKLESLIEDLRWAKHDLEFAKPSATDYINAWMGAKVFIENDIWFDLWNSKTYSSKDYLYSLLLYYSLLK